MGSLFRYTIRMLVREKDILIWVIAFPLILSTLFHTMFSGVDEHMKFDPADAVVVADERYDAPQAMFLRMVLDATSEEGDDQLLNVREVATTDEAADIVLAGDAAAYITVDEEGLPSMHVSPLASGTFDQSMVRTVLDRYRQMYGEMKQLLLQEGVDASDLQGAAALFDLQGLAGVDSGLTEADGSEGSSAADMFADWGDALASSGSGVQVASPALLRAAESFTADVVSTCQVAVLRTPASGTVRYYYALIGFAAVMAVTVSMTSVSNLRANTSAVGARRQLAGMPPIRQLLVTLAASFTLVFACLLLAFAFMRFVLGVGFGGREGLAVLALAVCSLMATGFGAVFGAIPKLSLAAKSGICTGISCLCALFAGLYGEPAMQLADSVAAQAPWSAYVNPAVQAANAFYDLTYYDTLSPFFTTIGVLLAMAVLFFAASAVLMRRQRYASL